MCRTGKPLQRSHIHCSLVKKAVQSFCCKPSSCSTSTNYSNYRGFEEGHLRCLWKERWKSRTSWKFFLGIVLSAVRDMVHSKPPPQRGASQRRGAEVDLAAVLGVASLSLADSSPCWSADATAACPAPLSSLLNFAVSVQRKSSSSTSNDRPALGATVNGFLPPSCGLHGPLTKDIASHRFDSLFCNKVTRSVSWSLFQCLLCCSRRSPFQSPASSCAGLGRSVALGGSQSSDRSSGCLHSDSLLLLLPRLLLLLPFYTAGGDAQIEIRCVYYAPGSDRCSVATGTPASPFHCILRLMAAILSRTTVCPTPLSVRWLRLPTSTTVDFKVKRTRG
ncbi:uncharacterized protein LOC133551476 isoform X2 [Nerophis ophidion]|uniref:uncharacterized protein LOC133551476 isoform X2 n=1 Tax=Nerophis ophidion TaxID=159077 RepID=UPI002AE0364B|nr:uncharacterized protein LOC133551476 isoform X2 [Nerophis ophidion]